MYWMPRYPRRTPNSHRSHPRGDWAVRGLSTEQLILTPHVSTCWPGLMQDMPPCGYRSTAVHVCVRSQIHREQVKDCVCYRCERRTSGWHISNTQKGRRDGAKPQRRAVPQSLDGRRLEGRDWDHRTTTYTCSFHICLPTNKDSSTASL